MKRDMNGKEIPLDLLKELENDWEWESEEVITYMKYEGKTFDDFLKTRDINNYYTDDDED